MFHVDHCKWEGNLCFVINRRWPFLALIVLISFIVCVCVCVIYHISIFIIIKKFIKNKQQSYQFDKGNISYNKAIRSNSLIIHFNQLVMYSKSLVTKWHSWSLLWGESGFESSSPTCCNNWIIFLKKWYWTLN